MNDINVNDMVNEYLSIGEKIAIFAHPPIIKCMMEESSVQIIVPKSDLPFLRKMAKRMGWTITSTKKSGLELGLDDIKAGRVYHASNAEEMMIQMHSQGE